MSTVIRIAVIYIFIVAALRVMGKREFGQLSPLELVTILLVPEIASQAMLGEDFSLTNALVGLSALFSIVFISGAIQFRFKKVGEVMNGVPSVLVHDGTMYAEKLELERVSEDELISEIHKAGLSHLEQVEWAILGTDGRIAVIPHRQPTPVLRSSGPSGGSVVG